MSAPAALATAEPEHAMPKPAAKIAEKVLARVHGRPSRQADEYLETLAEWQVGRADASLKRLLQALAADASATRAESGTAAGKYAPHAKDKAALHGNMARPDGMNATEESAARADDKTSAHENAARANGTSAAEGRSARAEYKTAVRGDASRMQGAVAADISGIVARAAQDWVLADFLSNGNRPSIIQALDETLDRLLRPLDARTLIALYQGSLAALQRHPPGPGLSPALIRKAGLPSAWHAWAASRLCDLIGRPQSEDDVIRLLRNAAIKRDPGIPVYDGTLRKTAMQLDLAVAAHAQPALMLRIRDRAQALLREEKNIVVNDFARIANQDLPDSSCAAAMAKALRRTLVPDPVFAAGAHAGSRLTDAHIRERLDAALDELLPGEIQALAAHLLTRPSATEARTRHLKHLLQDQGSGPVEKAALGRQFNLFCEALADRAKIGSPPPALRALQGWDWDQSLSRQDPPAHRPGRLQRLSAAVSRGARRAFAWLFDPGQAAAYRAQDARAELARASSDFLRTAGKIASQDDSLLVRQARRSRRWRLRYRQARNEPAPAADAQLRAFNENVLRLLKASERYKRACRALGEDACKSLDLATNPVRFHEAAFRDALALMPGAEANALGRACFGRDWASGLLERLEAYRDMAAADAPRAEATAATAQRRLAASDKNASVAQAMPLVADAQFLVHRMHNVLKEEPAVRAAAEVVRLLDRHIAGSLGLAANPDAGGIQAGADSNAGAVQAGADSNSIPVQAGADAGRVSVPAVADTMSAPLAAGGEPIAAEAPAAASDREASKQRLLDEIWTLEQRFRPLARKHGYTMDWSRDYFVDAGMSRVSPARRKRLQDAVTDIDRRPPEWLASDALWLAVVRHFQGARHLAA